MQQAITPDLFHEALAIGIQIAKNDKPIVSATSRLAIPRPEETKFL